MISRNVKTKVNRKYLSGTVDLKPSTDPYNSSDDELKGRSVVQEIDYQNPKKARQQVQDENLKNLILHKRK